MIKALFLIFLNVILMDKLRSHQSKYFISFEITAPHKNPRGYELHVSLCFSMWAFEANMICKSWLMPDFCRNPLNCGLISKAWLK